MTSLGQFYGIRLKGGSSALDYGWIDKAIPIGLFADRINICSFNFSAIDSVQTTLGHLGHILFTGDDYEDTKLVN